MPKPNRKNHSERRAKPHAVGSSFCIHDSEIKSFLQRRDMLAVQVNLVSLPQRNELFTQKPNLITHGVLDTQLLAQDGESMPVDFVYRDPCVIFDTKSIAERHQFFTD